MIGEIALLMDDALHCRCRTVAFLVELRPDLVNWADRAELAAANRGIDATMDRTASGGRVYLTAPNEHDTGAKLRAWLAEDKSILTVWDYIDGGEDADIQ